MAKFRRRSKNCPARETAGSTTGRFALALRLSVFTFLRRLIVRTTAFLHCREERTPPISPFERTVRQREMPVLSVPRWVLWLRGPINKFDPTEAPTERARKML